MYYKYFVSVDTFILLLWNWEDYERYEVYTLYIPALPICLSTTQNTTMEWDETKPEKSFDPKDVHCSHSRKPVLFPCCYFYI